jgi:predicted nucleotidyltransferase
MNSVARNDRPPESSSHTRDALEFAERIAAICSRVLGEIVASFIVHGSLALGDYTPRHSDIDLLGVVDRPLLDSEIELLTRAVAAERADAPALVDLRVVTRAAAAAPSKAPSMELYVRLDGSAPSEVESRHPGEPDLVVEFSICRAHGRALLGAEPHAVIGEVPDERVARGRCAVGALAITDRRRAACCSDGADGVPSLAIQSRTQPLLKSRGGIVGAGTRPLAQGSSRRNPPTVRGRRPDRPNRDRPPAEHRAHTHRCQPTPGDQVDVIS